MSATQSAEWFNDDASVTLAGLHVVAPEKGLPKSNGEQADALNPAITLWSHAQHRWRGVGDPCRSPDASWHHAAADLESLICQLPTSAVLNYIQTHDWRYS